MIEYVSSVIRHALTVGAGYLVAKGAVDTAGGEQLVGAIMGVVGLGWSLVHKYFLNKVKPESTAK